MKLLTRNTDYAVRAVCFIGKGGCAVVSAVDLVRGLKIPRPFLRKILQILTKRGILKSYKGLGGGFTLAAPAAKIRLLDITEAFHGPFHLNECIFKKVLCPNRRSCKLKKKMDDIERYVASELGRITIKDLLNA